jgi:hypothetical protein
VLEWAYGIGSPQLAGVFLVSVPDPAGAAFPAVAEGFGEVRMKELAVPTAVVSSSNDGFGTAAYHASVAASLGAELIDVGELGHVNAASGLGYWSDGWEILERTMLRR